MKLTWFGHSAFVLEFTHKSSKSKILIDPFLSGNPSFEGQDLDAVSKNVTHIALTHGHDDHVGNTLEIAEKTGATVLCAYDLGMWLQSRGLKKLDVGATGGTLHHEGFSMTFVQAHHSSGTIGEDGISHCLGNPNGLVFHIEGEKTVYHMGDTDIFSDMALIEELHRPQIGIVPVGDRFTMGGAVAALACRRYFNFETIIPCHYGTFPIIDQDASKFTAAMEDDVGKVTAAKPGETIEF